MEGEQQFKIFVVKEKPEKKFQKFIKQEGKETLFLKEIKKLLGRK